MKKLWKYLDHKAWTAGRKYRTALFLLSAIALLIGYILWRFISLYALSTWDWMFCFMGYPFILTWLMVFLYSCNHAFHDGRYSA